METKKKELGLGEKEEANLHKFWVTVNALNLEQIQKNKQVCAEFGLTLKKGSTAKVFFLEEDVLRERLKFAQNYGFLEEIKKDPLKLLENRLFVQVKKIESIPPIQNQDVTNIDDNLIISVLSKPQTIGLTDETYQRYEVLSNAINHILESLEGQINDNIDLIYDNLIKLVTSNIPNDELVIYSSIIFGRNLDPEEKQIVKNIIKKEVIGIINAMNGEEIEARKIA